MCDEIRKGFAKIKCNCNAGQICGCDDGYKIKDMRAFGGLHKPVVDGLLEKKITILSCHSCGKLVYIDNLGIKKYFDKLAIKNGRQLGRKLKNRLFVDNLFKSVIKLDFKCNHCNEYNLGVTMPGSLVNIYKS